MKQAQQFDPTLGEGEISLVLLDDQSILPVQETYFGTREATDVISFRYDRVPGDPGYQQGDILVNVERALREGQERDGGVAFELALYVAHGFDHLAGFDDATPEERRAMRERETTWLQAARAEGLLDNLLAPLPPEPTP